MSRSAARTYRDPLRPDLPLIPRDVWDFAPYHRWTFQHIREMTATEQIWRGRGGQMTISKDLQDLGGIGFGAATEAKTVAQYLEDSFTDGFLVIHDNSIVTETYMNGLKPHGTHLAMSVTKSIVGVVAGILSSRGLLDPEAPITQYLPELEATAYRGASVQHLLDMASGVTFDESYTTPGSHMQQIDQACGWKEHTRPGWPRTMWDLILSLAELDGEHGRVFNYRSIETDVLGLVLQRAGGLTLAELISDELWAPMGAEEDAYITVDDRGLALADGGFCATLRDYGRFAKLLLDGGNRDGRQIIPADWIEETRNGGGASFEGIYRKVLPNRAYHNKFWIEDTRRRTLLARGIHGQFIFVDPEARLAIVQLSTWPTPLNQALSIEFLRATHAIRRELCGV